MANEGGSGSVRGEDVVEESSSGSPCAGASPKNRVKFMCSHGGKIMPRPVDGQLKYVGGETRVIAVPSDITFSELMKKLNAEFEGDMILKYQVMPDELEVLVSVRTEEDLKHMFDLSGRHEIGGIPKLRAFLFPLNPPVPVEHHTCHYDPSAMEQRYIDAVNGTLRPSASSRPPPIKAKGPVFSISACSSPLSSSPDSNNGDSVHQEASSFMNTRSRSQMHKVHSMPNLCGLGLSMHQSSNQLNNYHAYQHPHPNYQQQQHNQFGYQHHRMPHDQHRLAMAFSTGHHDSGRLSPAGPGINQWYTSRQKMGSGNSNKYVYYNEYPGFVCRASDRSDGVPHSPRNRIFE